MSHYSIVFNTTAGSRRSIHVRNPNQALPIEIVSDAVAQILANDVFDPAKGSLESLNRLELNLNERIVLL